MIGKQIRERRTELGLTQDELAKKLGYKSKSSINKIELGVNDIPQSKIEQFAKALDTTPAYLMGWETKTDARLRIYHKRLNDLCDKLAKLSDLDLARIDERVDAMIEGYNAQ